MSRLEEARKHHKLVLERDNFSTEFSTRESVIYDVISSSNIEIKDTDCVSELYNSNLSSIYTTILNFASFTTPGGGWINGAWAQEESLCSESNLYQILSQFDDWYDFNRKHKNKGLYMDRAIFTPSVKFVRNDEICYSNVLTCAAPNYKAALEAGVSKDIIIDTYRKRVKYIYDILQINHQNLLIGGAWGCGVFGFPRDLATQIWKEEVKVNTILCYPQNASFKPHKS